MTAIKSKYVGIIDKSACILAHDKILSATMYLIVFSVIIALSACSAQQVHQIPASATSTAFEYTLGPGDVIDIFVWRNDDLSVAGIPVRPDGKISAPLVEDLPASGLTPKKLARDIEQQLSKYIKDPYVTITVRQFVGQLNDQIRVVGEATTPQSLPYRTNLTLLDVMIVVGGLTEFAAGNRSTIVRVEEGKQFQIPVRLKSLLKDGDINANVMMYPGDILIIPESWF